MTLVLKKKKPNGKGGFAREAGGDILNASRNKGDMLQEGEESRRRENTKGRREVSVEKYAVTSSNWGGHMGRMEIRGERESLISGDFDYEAGENLSPPREAKIR